MADILTQLYNACDPLKPAEDKYYVDLTDVRGGNLFIEKTCSELEKTTSSYLRTLISGHVGCGKSSELKQLVHELCCKTPAFPHKRYFPIYMDTQEYVDEYDASMTDILLSLVAEVAHAFREEGIELRDSYLEKRWNEAKSFMFSDLDIGKIETTLWSVKTELKLRMTSSHVRKEIRDKTEPQMSSLLNEINLFLIKARFEIKKHPPKDGGDQYTDIVIIFDNLEKIKRIQGHQTEEASHKALFLEDSDRFTRLDSHLVLTLPLSLVRSEGATLGSVYGITPEVLPNVKVEERKTHKKWVKGCDRLTELLMKRVSPALPKDVFTQEALDFLLTYSGGHIRQLMVFARESATFAKTTPISLSDVQKAVTRTVPIFSTSIRENEWEVLAKLELSARQTWDSNQPANRSLLERLCVLEYVNGDESKGVFVSPYPWYAVFPVVRELSQFKDAVTEQIASQNKKV